jgi:methionyl-tRNA formyltransferase
VRRILFVGAVEFSRHCLEHVFAAGGEVVGVLTLAPDHARFHGDYADLAPVAAAHGVPLHRIRNINDPDVLAIARSLRPDVVLVFGWSQLLRSEFLEIAPCIGSHPALLPRNRGRHPITWALVEGLEESGLTFFWLDAGADSGDIVWQRAFPITEDDDAASVYRKIEGLAANAIRDLIPQLQTGTAPRRAQNDAEATYWRRRTEADRWIDWRLPSRSVYNLVRGLSRPYVGALTRRGDQDVIVWQAGLQSKTDAPLDVEPGTVVVDGDGVRVRTGDGYLAVLELDPPGIVRVGDVLGRPA